MGDSASTNGHASPSPFRLFPWAQLAFLVACLAMAAWTWMRCSYAWDVTVRQLVEHMPPSSVHVSPGSAPTYTLHGVFAYDGALVKIRGELSRDPRLRELALYFSPEAVPLALDDSLGVVVITPQASESLGEATAVHVGRVRPGVADPPDCPLLLPVVDTTASRFTGESVAGLVVGAMGCFVFGVYLRRWILDRKAAA